jgi:hypothetical protein
MKNQDEFYIGWEEKASPSFGRRARLSSLLLLLAAAIVAFVLAASQSPFDEANFEFGNVRDVEGVVRLLPHPVLEVDTPTGGVDHWLLVAAGKHGADEQVADYEGDRVRLRGTLIYRGSEAGPALRTMVELVDGSVERLPDVGGEAGADMPQVSLGRHTLRGEIVDSKCWLGVMKPGYGKAHRACASLCIRGGIPPLLAVRDGDEVVRQLLLLGSAGEAVNDRILHAIAEPIAITGEVFVSGDVWTLHADLDTLERLTD